MLLQANPSMEQWPSIVDISKAPLRFCSALLALSPVARKESASTPYSIHGLCKLEAIPVLSD